MLLGSNPAGWLTFGVLCFLALASRFASVLLMEEAPMVKNSNSRRTKVRKDKKSNLYSVTNVKKFCSVSFETVWASIVGWSAGLASSTSLAPVRQRYR